MSFKGLETSKKLLKLTGEYVSSSDSENPNEEEKLGSGANSKRKLSSFEESKGGEASLTELPEDYDLVEEVQDEECEQLTKLLQEDQEEERTEDRQSISSEVVDDALAEQMRL